MKYFLILSIVVVTVAGSLTALATSKIPANQVIVWNQKKGQMENLQFFLGKNVIYYDSVNAKLCVHDERGIDLCTASLTPPSISNGR